MSAATEPPLVLQEEVLFITENFLQYWNLKH